MSLVYKDYVEKIAQMANRNIRMLNIPQRFKQYFTYMFVLSVMQSDTTVASMTKVHGKINFIDCFVYSNLIQKVLENFLLD